MLSATRSGSLRFLCQMCRVKDAWTCPAIAHYMSKYNIQNLYPNSSQLGSTPLPKHADYAENDKFTGYIPPDQLLVQYCKSSGPGGQNVNKVNSKVEIRFHVESAAWIPGWVKPKLLEQEKGRITKNGYLIVTSDKTRKQLLNQADCVTRIRNIVWQAAKTIEQAQPSEEDLEVMQLRKAKAVKEMLREKKEHSMKKHMRQKPSVHSI